MEVLECLLTVPHFRWMHTRALCFPGGFSASTVEAPDQDTDTGVATAAEYSHLGIVVVGEAARGGGRASVGAMATSHFESTTEEIETADLE
jgi:hypothetical protein